MTKLEEWKWKDIERNMVEFHRGINSKSLARKRFAQFSHWYYHPKLEIFAPSKFIGYTDTTHDNYEGFGSGGQTQQILSRYFDRVYENEYNELLNRLLYFADSQGLKVSKKTVDSNYGWIYKPNSNVTELFIKPDIGYDTDTDTEGYKFSEGHKKSVFVNKYERDPKTKKSALLIHGVTCMGCEFNFEEVYGIHGKDFIEIHHLRPLSSVQKEHYVDPKEDIAVLCANCHRMVHHRRSEPLTIEQLVELVRKNKKTKSKK